MVSKDLEGKEYAGFRVITKEPKLLDIQQITKEIKETTNQTLFSWYGISWNSCKLDCEAIEDASSSFLKRLRHGEI